MKSLPAWVWEICEGRGPQGPRGLKYHPHTPAASLAQCRGPQGPRGLKYDVPDFPPLLHESRSARTARIEISLPSGIFQSHGTSRSARTARIEMATPLFFLEFSLRRGPQGPRGLKYFWISTPFCQRGRGPQGPRGLKCLQASQAAQNNYRRGPQGPRGLK